MQLTFAQVREHYESTRKAVYRITEEAFADLRIQLKSISENDTIEADNWPDVHGVKSWSWQKGYGRYRRSPKRFDVAVTVESRLCAIAVGLPTHGKLALKIHVLEGRPHDNPIKGHSLPILFFAAHAYAKSLGALEVWICNPVNDRVIALYNELEYVPIRDRSGNVTHMKRSL